MHTKVTIHPSHSTMIPNLGEDEATILGQVNIIYSVLGIQVDIFISEKTSLSSSTDIANKD